MWTAEWDPASVRSSVGRPGKPFGGRTRFKALAPQALSIRPALGAVGLAPQVADRLKGRPREPRAGQLSIPILCRSIKINPSKRK